MAENGCSGGSYAVYITVLDKGGAPVNGIIIQQMYVSNITPPPTGDKGPGRTDALSGDAYKVGRDVTGRSYTSEWTKGLANVDSGISNADLIAGGFCENDADCNKRKAENGLCYKHYSYRVTFQRTW